MMCINSKHIYIPSWPTLFLSLRIRLASSFSCKGSSSFTVKVMLGWGQACWRLDSSLTLDSKSVVCAGSTSSKQAVCRAIWAQALDTFRAAQPSLGVSLEKIWDRISTGAPPHPCTQVYSRLQNWYQALHRCFSIYLLDNSSASCVAASPNNSHQ